MAKTYDAAMEMIDEASSFLGEKYVLDKRKMVFFPETCAAVDAFADAINCEVLDVNVKEGEPHLNFILITEYMVLDNTDLMQAFREIIPTMDAIRFTRAKYDDNSLVRLRIDLTIRKLWNRVDEQPS